MDALSSAFVSLVQFYHWENNRLHQTTTLCCHFEVYTFFLEKAVGYWEDFKTAVFAIQSQKDQSILKGFYVTFFLLMTILTFVKEAMLQVVFVSF